MQFDPHSVNVTPQKSWIAMWLSPSLFVLGLSLGHPLVVLRPEMANRLCVICQLWISKSGCLQPWGEAYKPGCIWVQLERILLLIIRLLLGYHTVGVMVSPFLSVWNGVLVAAYLYRSVRQGLRKEQSTTFHPDSGSSLLPKLQLLHWPDGCGGVLKAMKLE